LAQEFSATPSGAKTTLQVAVDFVLPDLTQTPGIASVETGAPEELSAVCFDTHDHRLIRNGLTLEHRTGATDGDWHLRIPLPDSDRNVRWEVRGPIGRGGAVVPPELLALARAGLRGRPVEPVAQLVIRRVPYRLIDVRGRPAVELTDDTVTVEATAAGPASVGWRELRFAPQGDGKIDVGEMLRAAGARSTPGVSAPARILLGEPGPSGAVADDPVPFAAVEDSAAGVVLVHLGALVIRLVAMDPLVRLDSAGAVRRMRVSVRRLRADLATFGPLFPARAEIEPLRIELGWLARVLGEARDIEVIGARLRTELDRQPAELIMGPVRDRVDRELSRDYRQAHIAVVQALNSARYLALLDGLEKFVGQRPLPPPESRKRVKRQLTRLADQAHKRVLRAIRRVESAPAGSDRGLLQHELRKAAKRSRYAAEAVTPVLGRPARRYAKKAATLQRVLGDHQDVVVLRARLVGLAGRAHLAAENAFSYGYMHALLEPRAHLDQAEVRTAWLGLIEQTVYWPG